MFISKHRLERMDKEIERLRSELRELKYATNMYPQGGCSENTRINEVVEMLLGKLGVKLVYTQAKNQLQDKQ